MKMFLVLLTVIASLTTSGQQINYSKTVNEDHYYTNFEIIGNVGKNYMIYKRVRWKHMLAVYDDQMREIRNRRMSFMPDDAAKVGFFVASDNLHAVFQYREGNTVFCKVSKVDSEGRRLTDPFTLDSTNILHDADKISYHLTTSEDKKHILLYKTQVEKMGLHFSYKLFNQALHLMSTGTDLLAFNHLTDLYTPPLINNEGSIILTKALLAERQDTSQVARTTSAALRSNIFELRLGIKKLNDLQFTFIGVPLEGVLIDEVKADIDNVNKRFILNALYYRTAGSIEGLFTVFIDPGNITSVRTAFNQFNDVLRKTLSSGGPLASAFNNLKLQDLTLKKNGGFIIAAEDSHFHFSKRPAYKPSGNVPYFLVQQQTPTSTGPSKAYDFRPHFIRNYTPSQKNIFKSIVVVDVDSALHINWNSVVNKYQIGDSPFSSYASYNTGSETHFLFSSHNEIKVVNNFGILPSGEFRKYNPVKTLAAGYIFMPRSSKQVGARKLIIPSYYRSTLAFALVDFSKSYGFEN